MLSIQGICMVDIRTIPDYYQAFRTSFANRLIGKLRERGYISKHGISGVNGNQLAKALGISLPMARRYINGKSIPTNITLHKLAKWLDTDPAWLLYGNVISDTYQEMDITLLQEIFSKLYPILSSTTLSKEKYDDVIINAIYIYRHVYTIKSELPKAKAITLMTDFMKKNLKAEKIY